MSNQYRTKLDLDRICMFTGFSEHVDGFVFVDGPVSNVTEDNVHYQIQAMMWEQDADGYVGQLVFCWAPNPTDQPKEFTLSYFEEDKILYTKTFSDILLSDEEGNEVEWSAIEEATPYHFHAKTCTDWIPFNGYV